RSKENVLPSTLARRGRFRLAGRAWEYRASLCVEKEVANTRSVARIHRRLWVDSDRWMIERKFSYHAILVDIQLLPVSLETVPVDELSIFQLKLDQVNVDRMRIFRQVGEVPCLGRADPGDLSDILIEVPPVNKHSKGIAADRILLLVQSEE